MKFWKMNGAGNDFVIINNLLEGLPADRLPGIARTVCERHMSIGADGFSSDANEAVKLVDSLMA
jgi:diaminopimelate epimerase